MQNALPKLQPVENGLGSIFDGADEALILHDFNGKIIDGNRSACEQLGYTKAELRQLSIKDVASSRFYQFFHERVSLVRQKGFAFFEASHITKEGKEIPIEVSCLLMANNGEPAILVSARDISDRKDAERVRTESAFIQSTISELVSDFIFKNVMHEDGTIEPIWTVGAMKKCTGFSLEELKALPNGWHSILHPDDVAKVESVLKKILSNEKIYHEYRIFYAATEEVRWVGEHIHPVWDDEKQRVTAFYGAVQNITEKKQAESAFREATLWLKSTFNALDAAIFIATADRKLVDMNKSAERMFGYSRQELLGLSSEHLHVDRAHFIAFGKRLQRSFKRGETARFEFEWKRKNGEIFPTEHVVTSLVQDDGKLLGILSVVRDISERRRAEIAIRESERKYRLLAENSSDIIVMFDKNFRITYASPSAERLTGFSMAEALAMQFKDVLTPESFQKSMQIFHARRTMFSNSRGMNYEVRMELQHVRKDGSTFWAEDILMPIWNEHHLLDGFLVTVRDISDRKKAEDSLRESEANLSALISNSEDQVWSVDQNYNLIVANVIFHEKFKSQFGVDLKIGESVLPIEVPERLRKKWRSIYNKALRGDRFRIQRKQGKEAQEYIDYLFNPIKTATGEVVGTTISGRDVTELIQARQLLEAESSFRHSIITSLSEGLSVCHDIDDAPFMKFTIWNDQMGKITGYTKDEINRTGWLFSLYPEKALQEKVQQRIQQMRNGQDVLHEEWEITHASGQKRTVLISMSLLHTNDGKQHFLSLMLDITERKQTERALFESQNRYRVATFAGKVGVWDWNVQTGEIFVDPHLKILLGYEEQDLSNHIDAWRVIIPSEDLALIEKSIEQHIENRTPHFEIAHRMFNKDGTVRWFLRRGYAVRKKGEVVRIVGTDTDITERKRVEESLTVREATLQGIFKAAQVGIGFSRRQILQEANDMLCQILGYQKEEMIGQHVKCFYSTEEEFVRVEKKKREQIEKYGASNVEMKGRCKDGTIIDLMLSIAPIRPKSIADGVIFTALDITQRKISETALRESEARYRTVSELMSDYIYSVLITNEGKMVLEWMTSGYAKITGSSPGESGWREKLLNMIFPADQALFTQHLQKARSGQKSKVEVRILSKNREQRWLRDYIKPIFEPGTGKLIRLVGAMQDITERKWAEAAMKESSKKYRLLAENSSDVIATLDKNLNFTYISPAVRRLLGYEPEEVLRMTPEDLLTEDSYRMAMKEYASRMEKMRYGQMWLYDFREEIELKRKDGLTVFAEYISTPLLDSDGQLIGFLTTARNITKRKHAEAALRLSEEKFSKAFRSSPDAMMIMRLSDGVYIDANDAFLEITGYSRDEVMGRTAFELGIWLSSKERERLISLLKQYKFVRNFEAPYVIKSGEPRFCQLSAEIIDIKGEPHIITIARDVTQKKRIEEKIYFQASLLEQVRNIVFVTDMEGRVTYWNHFAEIVYQWTSSEVVGKNAIDLLVPKAEQPLATKLYFHALEKGYWEGEQQLMRKDGRAFPCFCAVTLLKDPEGKNIGVIRVGTDVSERRELEEQLRQAQKMEAVGRLTGGVAHDFNNLLTAVLGNAEILEKKLTGNEFVLKNIERIKASATRGSELTRKLLTFSRQKKGFSKPVQINKCIENVIGLMEHTIDKRIDVLTSLCSENLVVMGDENQLEMVLLNLAVNASDAMSPVLDMKKEGKLCFETRIEKISKTFAEQHQLELAQSYVRISVSDTGTGIPDEIRQKIFEPFFTTKDIESGTGLGLAITYGAVKSHRGAILLESEVGVGSTFHIYLPRYKS
ncbi:PAS/PAC sensor signal transduction histidine kinase [Chloroherpeton thalassium ATCC 35110]|uniref:histidine kinase n=1 Tax=Chloroherpeton thalassium (strain ATCC 35110 / GB-78) TaxID=517418 RepID=B3QVY0_CHLT3|nr:PAS domain S-box protein [Chloroherpeton thalassium]ACF14634.1 PAS/PAC sensor signal transduction histidine kinase [Chloroherpeton thalassium ATCC 35110]